MVLYFGIKFFSFFWFLIHVYRNTNSLNGEEIDYEVNQAFRIHYLANGMKEATKTFDFWMMENEYCTFSSTASNKQKLTIRQMIAQNKLQATANYHCEVEFKNQTKDVPGALKEFVVDCTLTNGTDTIDGTLNNVCLYVNCDPKLLNYVQLGATINVTVTNTTVVTQSVITPTVEAKNIQPENPMDAVKNEIEAESKLAKQQQQTEKTNGQPTSEDATQIVDDEGSAQSLDPETQRRLLQLGLADEEGSSNETMTSIITTIFGVTFSVFALMMSFYWLYK